MYFPNVLGQTHRLAVRVGGKPSGGFSAELPGRSHRAVRTKGTYQELSVNQQLVSWPNDLDLYLVAERHQSGRKLLLPGVVLYRNNMEGSGQRVRTTPSPDAESVAVMLSLTNQASYYSRRLSANR